MINDKADEVIEELLQSPCNRLQNNLEKSMKGSDFVLNYVHLLYYKCLKINANRAGSYIDFPDWVRNKKATINPMNKKDNKCFQYAITGALNHNERWKKYKPYMDKYNWKGINYPSEKDDWKKNWKKVI